MKAFFRLIPKLAALVALAVLTGFVLLLLAYMLPVAPIEENVTKSADIFRREGTYPITDIMGVDTRLDNYTDALMLLSASYRGEESPLEKTLKVYRYASPVSDDPAITLVAHYGDGAEVSTTAYERYWHGYLITLKPLLSLLDYGQIRALNMVLVGAVTLCLLYLMYIRGISGYILPLVISLLILDPTAIVRSLQYSTIYYISILASCYLLFKLEWLTKQKDRLPLLFAAVGCVTSFFDLLTWPLASFGLPFCIFLASDKRDAGKHLRLMLLCLVSWSVGYGGMWAGKWLVAAAFGDTGAVKTALTIAFFRSSMADEAGYAFSYLDVLKRNLMHMIAPAALAALIYVIAALMLQRRRHGTGAGNGTWSNGLAVRTVLALLPFFWYLALGNHSYVHHWFTYRELGISAFALLSMLPPLPFGIKPKQKP